MFEQSVAAENIFLRDVQALRQDSQEAALTRPLSSLDRSLTIDLLQNLLAAEIVCVLRYSLLAICEDGLRNDWLATEFQAQANDERRHMAMLAKRIEALGGVPDFSPAAMNGRIAALGAQDCSFAVRLQQNLAAEQCVVAHYQELAAYFGPHDPETASVLRDILQDEEDHTSDMQDLLVSYTG